MHKARKMLIQNERNLRTASRDGNADEVRMILFEEMVDINNEWGLAKNGTTFLCMAAQNGHLEVLKLLVDGHADPNKANNNAMQCKRTPLHFAAMWGDIEVVKVLLDRGAEPDKADISGWTPLHWSALMGHINVIEKLLGRGANPEITNLAGETPLYVAKFPGMMTDVINNHHHLRK